MISKIANIFEFGKVEIEALNRPVGWDLFDGDQQYAVSRIKIA
jgi:hypothetical protein